MGLPVQDIATTLYYVRIRPDGARLEQAFRGGYELSRPGPSAATISATRSPSAA